LRALGFALERAVPSSKTHSSIDASECLRFTQGVPEHAGINEMLAPSCWQASGKICSLALAASCVRQHHQSMLSLFAASRIEPSSPQNVIEMGST
jgi:hypothetical protein